VAEPEPGIRPNWSAVITGAMLVVIIASQWFSTFANPLNDKFISISDSITRRFVVHEKDIGEVKQDLRDFRTETEKRRIEVATKTDVATLLGTTRLEFLAEVKRLDEMNRGDMKRDEFGAWKAERDGLIATILKRIETLETRK